MEYKLSLIELGKLKREAFMLEIAKMTRTSSSAQRIRQRHRSGDYARSRPMPELWRVVKEITTLFVRSLLVLDQQDTGWRQFEIEEVEGAAEKRTLGPLQGFRSKKGCRLRPCSGSCLMRNQKPQTRVRFRQDQNSDEPMKVDFFRPTAARKLS